MRGTQVRNPQFGKGGSARMFKQQAAGPAKCGITGKAQSPAPGAKPAKGGGKTELSGRGVRAKGGAPGGRCPPIWPIPFGLEATIISELRPPIELFSHSHS